MSKLISRPKLAIVSDAIYPYNTGGKEKRIFEISTRLKKYDVHIYTMKWWRGGNMRKENGVTLHAISPLYSLYKGDKRSIWEAILFSISCLKLLKEEFDLLEVDHMPHLVMFPLKAVAVLKRKKLHVVWSEVWGKKYWKEYLGALGAVAALIEIISSKLPDIVISVSEHTSVKLSKELKFKNKIYTIPNGINISLIKKIKPSKNKSDIIFAGRLLSHKNIDVLIRSVLVLKNKYPKIKCLIIGEGPERKNLEKIVKEFSLQNNVKFINFFKDEKDLYSHFKSSKVFLLPSTREGFGIVALEAAACGIPVITIDHKENATRDLIKKGDVSGLLSLLNEKDIVGSINRIFANPKKYMPNPDRLKNYGWDIIAQKIGVVYE